MKVLLINTVRFRLNGITSVIMNYFRNMDKNGLHTDFAVVNEIEDDFRNELEGYGARVFFVDKKKKTFKYIPNLNKLLKKERYDIVHIHGNSATMALEVILAKINRVEKIIVHVHNTTCQHPLLNKILRPVMMALATDFLACSDAAGEWLYKKSGYTVLKNAIDVEKFQFDLGSRAELRCELGIKDEFLIGHIGNFTEQKNHRFLINVFEEYHKNDPCSKLLLAGDGEKFEEMVQLVSEKKLSDAVIFTGNRSNPEQLYCAMDVFLLPSLWEGLPVVLVEAQASGLSCIVSDAVSKAADLTGIKFLPVDSTASWVGELERSKGVLTDREQCSERCAVKIIEAGYDIKREAERLANFYFKTL